MAKRSKQIDNRLESTGKVIRAATTHAEQIAEALAAKAIEIEGPNTKATADVFRILFAFLGNTLDHSGKLLEKADQAVTGERADDGPLREKRDSLEIDVNARMVRVRSNVLDALGPEALKTYGLEGTTPRHARELGTHASNVASLLRQKPFVVEVDGVTYDSGKIAATLEAKASEIAAVVADLEREDQELADVLGRREKVLEGWGDTYQGAADALTGLYRLGGRKDLSERVRPTNRTLRGEDTGPDVDETQAGAEAPAPEPTPADKNKG